MAVKHCRYSGAEWQSPDGACRDQEAIAVIADAPPLPAVASHDSHHVLLEATYRLMASFILYIMSIETFQFSRLQIQIRADG